MPLSETRSRTVPLLDLQAQYRSIRREILEAIHNVVESQRFVLGPEVEEFERAMATYSHTEWAVGCASGSDALLLALMALDVGAGDEVATVPFTFFATAGAIHHTGAKPVFVDIDPATFNMDPELLKETLAAHPKVKAVIPVHLFGGCADMDPIRAIAERHGVAVIEDAAQAIGAEYRGRRAGSMSDVGCFSFFPSKNLGAFGDGGICTTSRPELAARVRALRVHGSQTRYYHEWVGVNSRLDEVQAAVLRVKFRHLDVWTEARRKNADLYRQLLAGSPVTLPQPAPYQTRHVVNQFVVRCPRRDALREHLALRGIGTEIYYPLPLHLQVCFEYLGYKPGDFPSSERAAAEVLALPVYPELTSEDIAYVASAVQTFYGAAA